jgi:hypothetical protein
MDRTRQWHCMVNGQKYGPVIETELRVWVGQGRLGHSDAVWTEGMGQWRPLHEVQHMFAAGLPVPHVPPAGPAYPPHRGILVLVLGIVGLCVNVLGLGLILGGLAWYMGNEELRRMDAGQADPAGRGMVTAGKICGIIGFFLGIFSCCVTAIWFAMILGMAGVQGF